MSEGDNNKPAAIPMKLTIEFQVDGGMQVQGPGDGKMFDEPLCFWILEKAKDFIKFRNMQAMQAAKSNIYIPDRLRGRV